MLTAITFVPLLGAAVIALLLPRNNASAIRKVALLFTGVDLVLALVLYQMFDLAQTKIQFLEQAPWIPQFDVYYRMGVDGLNLPMVFLNALLFFVAVLVSWKIENRPKEYFALLLVLQTGVFGVFLSLDLFLFFLFWEVELAPMFLLIGIWGTGRREYSAMKFLIYTLFGSAFMLVGILWLYFTSTPRSFDMLALASGQARVAPAFAMVIFFLIFVAFSIKLPVVPFHTWLPDAHVDAPTAVSVILAGVLLKMGGYGMFRIGMSIFPDVVHTVAPYLAVFALINIVYGAAVCTVQKDLKKLVAYSSVSHMGMVLLGLSALTPMGIAGAQFVMFSHGLVSGLMFALVGLTYEKTHTRIIAELGGLAAVMPVVGVLWGVAGLANLGLPATSGFVGEFMVFLGAFPTWNAFTMIATLGVLMSAGYMLWMLQRAMFGPLNPHYVKLGDATWIERAPLYTLVAFTILIGIWPALLVNVINNWIAVIPGVRG